MSTNVIIGKDVVLDIFKVDDYYPFVCAENVSIEITQETKSVKTIGDGVWAAYRGQRLGFTVSGDGLIPFDDITNVNIFDVLDRQINMLSVPFRMVFPEPSGVVYKAIYGEGYIVTTNLTGPNDFAGSTFSILGSGPLVIYDGLTACDGIIATLVLNSQTDTTATFGYTGATLATRFDYIVMSGLFVIASDSIIAPALPNGSFTVTGLFANGSQTITVTPKCASGFAGTPFPLNYTKT